MSAPYRPHDNGHAERFNRLMIEGTRCFLLEAGLGERWWHLAISPWCINYNAHYQGPDGLAPWLRRFGAGSELKACPVGAFVMYNHPKDYHFHGSKAVNDKRVAKKLRNRLVPAIYV